MNKKFVYQVGNVMTRADGRLGKTTDVAAVATQTATATNYTALTVTVVRLRVRNQGMLPPRT
jgi:hypothetical protein